MTSQFMKASEVIPMDCLGAGIACHCREPRIVTNWKLWESEWSKGAKKVFGFFSVEDRESVIWALCNGCDRFYYDAG